MWQSLGLARKIWLSLSILILGYFASMVFGFVLGEKTESRLQDVSGSLFPAAMESQRALSAFNNQITRYSEAVMAGDPDLLDTARQQSDLVEQALQAMIALTGLPPGKHAEVRDCLTRFETFTTSAQTVYAEMSESSDDLDALAAMAELKQQAAQLAEQTEQIRQTLDTFTTLFAELLTTEVSAIREANKQNRYQNIAVFVFVVFLAMLVVHFIITRGITRPVTTLVTIAHAIARGDFSQELPMSGKDEIGELAGAFRHMKDTIREVLQETERLLYAVQQGQLTVRGEAESFSGGWRDLVVGVNAVIDAFVTPINMTAEAIERIARGDIPERIAEEHQGEFNKITLNLNTLIDAMQEVSQVAENIAQGNLSGMVNERSEQDRLMQALNVMITRLNTILAEIATVTQAIQMGQIDVRGAAEQYEGSWRDMVVGINHMLDAFGEPITVAAETIDRIAKGNVPEKLEGEFQGDFNTMQQNLNALIRAIHEMTRLAEEMARGNFTVEVKERSDQDTLMQALNSMRNQLKAVVLQVKSAADTVAVGSNEIRKTSEHMSLGATKQAAAAEEASSAMEQMAANIRQNADNALHTEQIAKQSVEYAEKSGEVVVGTVRAMQQITKKISIIQEIASRTHLLSLNATIEAARAQDHGKAFSVVAAEVRHLSDSTNAAAEEIDELANSSLDISEKAGEMLTTLVPNIKKTADLVKEISAASNEQSQGTEQVNKAIQELDQVTQQNAMTSEQMASTAEELASQAQQLQQMIAFFCVKTRSEDLREKAFLSVLDEQTGRLQGHASYEKEVVDKENGNRYDTFPLPGESDSADSEERYEHF